MNAFEKIMDQLFRLEHPDRADTKIELPPYEQRLADAFLEMCRRSTPATIWCPVRGGRGPRSI